MSVCTQGFIQVNTPYRIASYPELYLNQEGHSMSKLFTQDEVDEMIAQAVLEAMADRNPEQRTPEEIAEGVNLALLARALEMKEIDPAPLDDLVDAFKSAEGSAINNGGIYPQLQYIHSQVGLDGLKKYLTEQGLL